MMLSYDYDEAMVKILTNYTNMDVLWYETLLNAKNVILTKRG